MSCTSLFKSMLLEAVDRGGVFEACRGPHASTSFTALDSEFVGPFGSLWHTLLDSVGSNK